MTTPTPTPDETREYVRNLFGSRPEPQRPDETPEQAFARQLFTDDTDND